MKYFKNFKQIIGRVNIRPGLENFLRNFRLDETRLSQFSPQSRPIWRMWLRPRPGLSWSPFPPGAFSRTSRRVSLYTSRVMGELRGNINWGRYVRRFTIISGTILFSWMDGESLILRPTLDGIGSFFGVNGPALRGLIEARVQQVLRIIGLRPSVPVINVDESEIHESDRILVEIQTRLAQSGRSPTQIQEEIEALTMMLEERPEHTSVIGHFIKTLKALQASEPPSPKGFGVYKLFDDLFRGGTPPKAGQEFVIGLAIFAAITSFATIILAKGVNPLTFISLSLVTVFSFLSGEAIDFSDIDLPDKEERTCNTVEESCGTKNGEVFSSSKEVSGPPGA